jgi:hypothetical protein
MKLGMVFCFFASALIISSWAQDYNYRLSGTFSTPQSSRPVAFNLSWSEDDESIEGTYQDNFFTSRGTVTGTSGNQGRIFNITFPEVNNKAKSLTIVTTASDANSGEVPLTLTLRNQEGVTLASHNTTGLINRAAATGVIAEREEEEGGCNAGLGALNGTCGIYQGSLIETFDSASRCTLNTVGTIALEVSRTGRLQLFTNYINTTVNLPAHPLGDVREAESRSIIEDSRHCGALAGTNFFEGNCQRLSLIGSFSRSETPSFNGTYTITDEITGEKCSYSLEMVREIDY